MIRLNMGGRGDQSPVAGGRRFQCDLLVDLVRFENQTSLKDTFAKYHERQNKTLHAAEHYQRSVSNNDISTR